MYKSLIGLILLVPIVITPARELHKDPEAILSGKHDFFLPFLDEENIAIVRNYPEWRNEILGHFAQRIQTYNTYVSEYISDIDPALVAQAQNILKKEYQQLMIKLGDPIMIALDEAQQALLKAQAYFGDTASNTMAKERHVNKEIDTAEKNIQEIQNVLRGGEILLTPKTPANTNKVLSAEDRVKLNSLLQQTKGQLFGPAPEQPTDPRLLVEGGQHPKLEDFQRRAEIEDMYACINQELAAYANYAKLSKKDKALIAKTVAHVEEKYHETLDAEGLKTTALMSNS